MNPHRATYVVHTRNQELGVVHCAIEVVRTNAKHSITQMSNTSCAAADRRPGRRTPAGGRRLSGGRATEQHRPAGHNRSTARAQPLGFARVDASNSPPRATCPCQSACPPLALIGCADPRFDSAGVNPLGFRRAAAGGDGGDDRQGIPDSDLARRTRTEKGAMGGPAGASTFAGLHNIYWAWATFLQKVIVDVRKRAEGKSSKKISPFCPSLSVP